MKKFSWRFYLGIFFLVINLPLGWLGLVYFTYLGLQTHQGIYYGLAAGVYIFSWLLLFLGGYLAGKEGIKYLKNFGKYLQWPKTSPH